MRAAKPATGHSTFEMVGRHWIGFIGTFALGVLAVVAGCGSSSPNDDECSITAQQEIEPLFRIHFLVSMQDGSPFLNQVNFLSEKHYCNGTVKGKFTDVSATTQNGYWKPITTQYKLANTKDFVRVRFTTGSYSATYDYSYFKVNNGMKLEGFQMVFEDTIKVHLNF
jgi:hypothetical protein